MALDLGYLQNELQDEGVFNEWLYREEVSSTMDVVRELAEAGAPEGTVVIAARQTAGRGRHGRDWESPEGGAWLSLLLRPPIELTQAGCISVLLAVAVAQALRERYELPILVKWPNDLLVDGRKLGGILVELATVGGRIEWLIAGVGLNVNNPLPRAPGVHLPPISLAVALGHDVELLEVYAIVLREIARGYRGFLREGFEPVRRKWTELSALEVEEIINVRRGEERFEAHVRGLSELGRLVVERERAGAGRIEELIAEEVTLSLKVELKEGVK
jgi:BirA family biotin operon repressor/biotin-[acetyl-CoA-carboxylase] ligase